MQIDTEDLAGFLELGEMIHVKRGTVGSWQKQPDFPEPVLRLSMGPIFSKREFLAWWHEWYPRKQQLKLGYLDDQEQESQAGILERDLRFEYFTDRTQPVNEGPRGVAVTHLPTGKEFVATDGKSQLENKATVLKALREYLDEQESNA